MKKSLLALLFVAGLAGSIFATWVQTKAFASRNNSGVYSLPAGNPVSSGTTITSSWANTTLADMGTEITNSLDRSGRGAMTAPLQLSSGAASAPGLTWSAETTSGLYRSASNTFGMQVGGSTEQQWSATGSTITGLGSNATALTVTPGSGNYTGLSITGAGTSAAITATGGNSGGAGITATGGTGGGNGVRATGGATNGIGVYATGTGTFDGVFTTGGSTNGRGVHATGGGTGAGGVFDNGTSATATTYQDAIQATNGDIALQATNPNSNVGFSNKLTGKNTPKAWVQFASGVSGAVTIGDGFNISGVSIAGNVATVSFATAMGSANYVPVCSSSNGTSFNAVIGISGLGTGSFAITAFNANLGSQLSLSGNTLNFYCAVFGAQ